MADLAQKTALMASEGHFSAPPLEPTTFEAEVARFLEHLEKLKRIISDQPIELDLSKKLLQGPILDMTTHVGQIAMLNGINGNKVPKQNYFAARVD